MASPRNMSIKLSREYVMDDERRTISNIWNKRIIEGQSDLNNCYRVNGISMFQRRRGPSLYWHSQCPRTFWPTFAGFQQFCGKVALLNALSNCNSRSLRAKPRSKLTDRRCRAPHGADLCIPAQTSLIAACRTITTPLMLARVARAAEQSATEFRRTSVAIPRLRPVGRSRSVRG